jgi:lysophospholipase L1-like esterase
MNARISRRSFVKLGLAAAASTWAPLSALLSACSQGSPGSAGATAIPVEPAETPVPDVLPHTYAPDDPNIRYTGRIDFSDPARPRFSAPGVYIRARFRGTGAAVLLEDEFKWGTSRNYYDAVIDYSTVVKISPEQSRIRYPLASGLPYGEHNLTLVKRTEASVGACTFLGFEFDGEALPSGEAASRRIEFVGDSITCGAGDEARVNSEQCQEDGWGQPYNNARLSYGPVLARGLGADYHLTAVSGIGMVRNYSFLYDARPMPEVYDTLFLEQSDSPVWDPARFVPDALVIALGTNDFSPGDSDRPIMEVGVWAQACVQFVEKLRGYFPDATLFLASSPMLGDNWPTHAYKSATDQKTAISQVVETFNQRGDAKVYKFLASPIVGMGCGTHPDVSQHAAIATQLGGFIASVMGW